METNEIMVNEEVVDTVEEIVDTSSGNGFGKTIGVVLLVLGGMVVYKYVGKPVIAKVKTKLKRDKTVLVYDENIDDTSNREESDETN